MKAGVVTIFATGLAFLAGWGAARSFHSTVEQTDRRERPRAVRVVAETEARERASAKAEAQAQREATAREEFIANLKKGVTLADLGQFSEWAKTAPLAELEAVIAALGPSPEPTWAICELVTLLAARDPQAALRRFETWTAFARFQLIGTVVAGWATEDPKAALAWLATQPPNAATDGSREAALTHMAAADPQAALATLRAHDWLWDSPQALRGIFRSWVKSDPKTALEQWRSLNLELNPPFSPGAEPPIAPQTMELIATALGQAAESKKSEAIEAVMGYLEPRELARIDAALWNYAVIQHDPMDFLPMLEQRLDIKKMSSLVKAALHFAPVEKREVIAAALKHPELKALALPPAPFPQTERLPPSDFIPTGDRKTNRDGDFWDTPLKLD